MIAMRSEPISNPAATACVPGNCRLGCSLEIIDALLRSHGTVRGDEVDMLLDLRWFLHHREDCENALALFCQLRVAMEERHYLAFYRLRRWLENHIQVNLRASSETELLIPLKLDRYCIEAVRHHCVQSAVPLGMSAPRARFVFRPVVSTGEKTGLGKNREMIV